MFDLPDGEDRGDATVGTVTAGNAPGDHRRRGGVVVASRAGGGAARPQPLARVVGYAQAEVAPRWLFLAPIEGVRALRAPDRARPDATTTSSR